LFFVYQLCRGYAGLSVDGPLQGSHTVRPRRANRKRRAKLKADVLQQTPDHQMVLRQTDDLNFDGAINSTYTAISPIQDRTEIAPNTLLGNCAETVVKRVHVCSLVLFSDRILLDSNRCEEIIMAERKQSNEQLKEAEYARRKRRDEEVTDSRWWDEVEKPDMRIRRKGEGESSSAMRDQSQTRPIGRPGIDNLLTCELPTMDEIAEGEWADGEYFRMDMEEAQGIAQEVLEHEKKMVPFKGKHQIKIISSDPASSGKDESTVQVGEESAVDTTKPSTSTSSQFLSTTTSTNLPSSSASSTSRVNTLSSTDSSSSEGPSTAIIIDKDEAELLEEEKGGSGRKLGEEEEELLLSGEESVPPKAGEEQPVQDVVMEVEEEVGESENEKEERLNQERFARLEQERQLGAEQEEREEAERLEAKRLAKIAH
ncbi:MAG: hypothetical protein GY820_47860, partial [Gammaproteobacteria bacterium]|nr:hypothetical protein [Gammaproteobacteria bacterium]